MDGTWRFGLHIDSPLNMDIGNDMYAWNQAMFEVSLSLSRDKNGWDSKSLVDFDYIRNHL